MITCFSWSKVYSSPKYVTVISENSINLSTNSDDPKAIAETYKPEGSSVVHEVIKTDLWGYQDVVIVFYEFRYQEKGEYPHERQYVEGYLLIPDSKGKYQMVLIDELQDDNVDTVIESVFFANADKDSLKELFIISSATHHLQYLYEGVEYSVSGYNNIATNSKLPKALKRLNLNIDGGFEGYTEDEAGRENHHANFRTAQEVKKELKRRGF